MDLIRLPTESLLLITSYLEVHELLRLFSVLNRLEYIMFHKTTVEKVNLYRKTVLPLEFKYFSSNKVVQENITFLNINCCSSIPTIHLQLGIPKLILLENLYMLETSFRARKTNLVLLNNLKKLRRLAISAAAVFDSENDWDSFPETLTGLCLHLQNCDKEEMILAPKRMLEELWLVFQKDPPKSLRFNSDTLPQPIFLSSQNHLPINLNGSYSYISVFDDCQVFCEQGRSFFMFEMIVKDDRMPCIIELFRQLEGVSRTMLFALGLQDSKEILKNQDAIKNMDLEELNIRNIYSYNQLILGGFSALLLPKISLLKKLSVNYLFCEYPMDILPGIPFNAIDPYGRPPLFKKRRIGYDKLQKPSILELIFKRTPLLEEFEMWDFSSVCHTRDATFSSIRNLTNLTKLTLDDVPLPVTGAFLVDVCKNCKHLSSLRIRTSLRHSHLNQSLCHALPYATSLKDFRYDQRFIPLDDLFKALNRIENSKLQRVAIKTYETNIFSEESLQQFLKSTLHLCFLYLYIDDMPKSSVKHIRKTLTSYNKKYGNYLIVGNKTTVQTARNKIPRVHFEEMVEFKTRVSVVNVYDGFR